MKRKSIVLVLCMMLMMVFVGCGKEVAEENSTPPTSEVVSEVVSEEVSEPVSEEHSEEVVSEEVVEEIEYTNFSSYNELFEYIKELNKTTIVWFNFTKGTEQAIIPNGEKYTLEGDDSIMVISTNNNIIDVKANVEYIDALKLESKENVWMVFVETTGTDLEVSFTVVYEDGIEEDFTVYLTVEGE